MLYSKAMEIKYPEYKIVETKFDLIKYAKKKGKNTVKERKDIPLEEMGDYERYFISIPFNEENYKVFEDYVKDSLENINNAKELNEWKPKKNNFFCKNLCSVSDNCKYYKQAQYGN